jgi:hypothetical protein
LTAGPGAIAFCGLPGIAIACTDDGLYSIVNYSKEIRMKRLALIAAVFAFAACKGKEEAPAAAPAASTPAMAPSPADTAAKKMDSLAAKMDTSMKKMDSAGTKMQAAGKAAVEAGKEAKDAAKGATTKKP